MKTITWKEIGAVVRKANPLLGVTEQMKLAGAEWKKVKAGTHAEYTQAAAAPKAAPKAKTEKKEKKEKKGKKSKGSVPLAEDAENDAENDAEEDAENDAKKDAAKADKKYTIPEFVEMIESCGPRIVKKVEKVLTQKGGCVGSCAMGGGKTKKTRKSKKSKSKSKSKKGATKKTRKNKKSKK